MKKLLSILGLSFCIGASAQTYSIDWRKIAGGGGTSSGGNYSLTGTIGQHDAGQMAGGNYTLEGGFISGIVLIQTTGAPQLFIQFDGSNATVFWAADASTGFVLEESATMNVPVSWSATGATVTTLGNTKSVTIPAAGTKFYRLHKP